MKGKTCSKLANGLKFYVFKKKLTPGIALTRCPGVIYMFITILVKQVYWYLSWVSDERLQDHWSSGLSFQVGARAGVYELLDNLAFYDFDNTVTDLKYLSRRWKLHMPDLPYHGGLA